MLRVLGRRALHRYAESKHTEQFDGFLTEFLNITGQRLAERHRLALVDLQEGFARFGDIGKLREITLRRAVTHRRDVGDLLG